MYNIYTMGLNVNFDDEKHQRLRERSTSYYHSGNGKKLHRLRYLMKRNNIQETEIQGINNIDDKVKHCELIHILKKHKNLFH